MRRIIGILALGWLSGCDSGSGRSTDASLRSSSGGEVALADGGSLEFSITSQKYKQWDAARKGINRGVAARFGELLQPDGPTERTIARAVEYLESQAGARQSIEGAGMSVRDFVVMTVALEQEMRLASGKAVRVTRRQDHYDFPPVDTTFIPPQPATPVPEPLPVDSLSRRDSVAPNPNPLPDTAIRRVPTIFRRDTAMPMPRRDSVAPLPAPNSRKPVTRDTVRDTLPPPPPPLPPDTLSKT